MTNIRWRQLFEKTYPYLWALVAATGMYCYGPALELRLTDTLISTTTTITSIVMGFLGTAYGILLSATSKRIEWAKGHKRIWTYVLRFFNESFIANFVLCIYSIGLALLTPTSLPEDVIHIASVTWALLIALSIVSFFRAMRVLLGLLRTDA